MFSCKCLNIVIHIKNNDIQKVEVDSLQLSDFEKNDEFFKKELNRVELDKISKEQPGLITSRKAGVWIVHKCLNCSLDTFAIHQERNIRSLIATDLLSGTSNIALLRNNKNHSSTFRILINSESSAETDMSKIPVSQVSNVQSVLNNLQHQLAEALRRETAAAEERILRYTEMQYAALEALREQAHREHCTLVGLVLNSQLAEPMSESGAISSDENINSSSPRHSITKPKNPLVSNLMKTKRIVSRQLSHPVNRRDSVDAEGVFSLEDMEESPGLTHSDVEESDTDDSASHDEGIHIPRQRVQSMSMAKSLPMNIPVFMSMYTHDAEDKHDNKAKEDSVDIAANIQALANSVHGGDDIFGDLPRPRINNKH